MFQLRHRVELQPHRNAEAVAQRRRQQPEPGRRADQRELGEIDPHRARRRPFADDQVELEILHRRIEDLLDRRDEAVDLVDEEDVALLEIGQQRREIAGLGDHRARCRAEIDAEFARDDLRQRRLAEAGRPDEEHVVERLLAPARRLDEDRKIGARLRLADEIGQHLRPQRAIIVVLLDLRRDKALFGRTAHRASSFRPRRISTSVVAPSPALRIAAATAALACTCG